MPNPLNVPITPPRVAFIDPRTGTVSREWYMFFLSLFQLTNGSAVSLDDVQKGPPMLTIDEINVIVDKASENLRPSTEGVVEQIAELQKQIEGLQESPESCCADEIAELQKQIQALEVQVRPELGTMSQLQQANLPWVTFDTTPQSLPTDIGTVAWDGGTTLGIQMTANVLQPVGEAQYFYIKADSTITKGQLIMFTGAVGASGVIRGAPATGLTDGQYLMGIAAENIATNGFGLVTSFGHVRGWNTTGAPVGETWVDGDILYYNPSVAGGLTKTQPTAPNVKATIAVVVNAAPAGSGDVFVRVSTGSVLGGTDSNVQFGTLANGDLIQYDSALGYWKNVPATTVGVTSFSAGTTGFTPSTASSGAVTLAGTLRVANGGTGVTTTPTNGQLLIGNGTGYTVANLTAGTNISISNTAGGITINSSNPGGTVTSVGLSAPTGFAVSGSPVTGSGTLALSFAAGYSLPTNASQTNWDTAFSERRQWDGGSTGLVAATGRTSLGATTVGSNLFTLANPSAVTYMRINADNSVSTLDAATFRTAIGAGTGNGTVTSVATGTGLTGGPITSTGTISFSVAAVGTWAATPSSANLAAAMTDETGSGPLVFATRPSFTSTIGVGGTTASASGAGVSFPATKSPSTDVNTLDDYEEGTFNLNYGTFLNVSGSWGQANCVYTKIGRHVFVSATISGTGMGVNTNGYIQFTGMPFTVATNSAGSWGSTSISSQIAGTVVATGTEFWLYASNNNNTTSSIWLSFSFPV